MTYKTIIIEKEVPVKWPDGMTKVKVSFELPIPPIPDDIKDLMNMDAKTAIVESFKPIVELLSHYLAAIQSSGIPGGTNAVPRLQEGITEAAKKMFYVVEESKRNKDNYEKD